MINIEPYLGKYYLWDNGLRLKVIGACEKYPGEWVLESAADGHQWNFVAYDGRNMDGWTELTEEQAKAQYIDISTGVIQAVVCGTCCGWKCGKEEFSVKMNLKDGKIPNDEAVRLQDAIRKFFQKHEVYGVIPYIHRKDGGIEISFISTK